MKKWKDIKNYEGLYQISNHGEVRRNNRILKNLSYPNEYLYVSLCKQGEVKNRMIHRLVALHFIPNPDNKKEVNHKDGNRKNPHVSNLEWVTCSENHKHAFEKLGRKHSKPMKGRFGKSHNRSKQFSLKTPDGKVLTFGSGLEAQRKLGIDHSSISYARKHNKLPHTFKKGKLKGFTLLEIDE